MLKPPLLRSVIAVLFFVATASAYSYFRSPFAYKASDPTDVVLTVNKVLSVINHVEVEVTLSTAGTVYCKAQLPQESEPTVQILKNAGSKVAVEASVPSVVQYTELAGGTSYDVYCYAEDADGRATTTSIASTKRQVLTQVESEAPFMIIDTIIPDITSFVVDVVASEPGTFTCLYQPSGLALPSYSRILEVGSKVSSPNTFDTLSISFEGVTSETAYDVYCVFQSTDGLFMRGPLNKLRKTVTTLTKGTSVGMLVVQIVLCVILVAMSGMFSGLNLGLMSLDVISLKMVAESDVTEIAGTDLNDAEVQEMIRQKEYAKKVQPIRKEGNLLLVTLLIGNVMVNSLISILSADFTSGVWGFIISTVFITTFGEIIPQAYCARNGLQFGANTIWYTRAIMTLLWIICKPVSMLLDCMLGEELGNVYNRWQLYTMFELYKDKNKFGEETISTMQGALAMDTSTIGIACTPLDKVYMLPYSQVLDQNTCLDIFTKGYSRIPIYKDTRDNIVGILYVKDLILIDPHEKVPVSTMLELFRRPMISLDSNTTHAKALKEMTSQYVQICLVTEVVEIPNRDNDIRIKGIVTLEDLIESVFKMDINDETDAPSMEAITHTTTQVEKFFDSMHIANIDDNLLIILETFLHNAIRHHGYEVDSESVVQLIKCGELKKIPTNGEDLYTYQKPSDCCTMLLEGLVECEIGKEKIITEKSRFSVFGFLALIEDNYISEMTVRAKEIMITDFITQQTTGYVNEALILVIHKADADKLDFKSRLSTFTGQTITIYPRQSTRFVNNKMRRKLSSGVSTDRAEKKEEKSEMQHFDVEIPKM